MIELAFSFNFGRERKDEGFENIQLESLEKDWNYFKKRLELLRLPIVKSTRSFCITEKLSHFP
jgi:hypothetical protein